MRTKTILTAAAGMLCAASALAVTSVNVVGYVNVNLVTGFNLVAPPLQAANTTVAAILPTVPDGTTLQKWNTTTQQFYDAVTFDSLLFGGWDFPATAIAAGEAVFINVTAPTTLTFVGDVRQSGAGTLDTPLVAGFTFVGSQVPQTGLLTDTLGFLPADGDTSQQWDAVGQTFLNANTYDSLLFGGWDTQPSLGMAEGVVLNRTAPGVWSRNFNVQ